jgi:hypothetical protein
MSAGGGVANNIRELTTTTPIPAGGLLETDGFFVGEFAGISSLAYCDLNVTVEYWFSGDNVWFPSGQV